MITALDSSIIIDVLIDDPKHASASEAALGRARQDGSLVLCETVLAEVVPVLGDEEAEAFLSDWEISFVPSSRASALMAGGLFRQYLKRGGKRNRVLADFMVGAHAKCFANRLLTRDRGYYRDYFKDLEIWNP